MQIIHGLDVTALAPALDTTAQKAHPGSLGIDIAAWFAEHFDGKLLEERCMVRRVDGDGYVPWHIDANLVGYDIPTWTIWIPLTEIDDATPGLEFAAHSHPDIASAWKKVPADSARGHALSDDGLRKLVGEYSAWMPHLSVGQALMFDQFEIHRTAVMNKHKPRVSIDVRFRHAAA